MKSLRLFTPLLYTFLASFWTSTAMGEPVQYCKFSASNAANEEIDFCMGALLYQNASSNAHDLYLTIRVPRPDSSPLGWTAIGTGSVMEDSLMFIIYGDPLSNKNPIVSIRTADGHHQPTLLKQGDIPTGMDLRVIRASWLLLDGYEHHIPDSSAHAAWVSLVCYSCHLWQGTAIAAKAKSQPWIWAWNANQKFDVFSYDAHLDMHKHHTGAGGWGNFYVDMSSSISTAKFPPSLPPIRPNVVTLGTSDMPMSFSDSVMKVAVGPGSYLHGLILGSVFLLLFPAGVGSLRVGSSKSFKYHWVIQIIASCLLFFGLILGLLKRHDIDTFHQWAGVGVASMIGLQGFLGWWHHRKFVQIHRRTWVSYLHIWLGRLMILVGWSNVVSGLYLRGYGKSSLAVVTLIVVICLEASGFSAWTLWRQRKRVKSVSGPAWVKIGEENFALTSSDDEDDQSEVLDAREEKDETRPNQANHGDILAARL
jgi:hypothetical protein